MDIIRICYVVTVPITIKSFYIPQLVYLSENGFDVTVICSTDGDGSFLPECIKYIPLEIPRGVKPAGMVKAYRELKKIFTAEKYDIVQYSTPNAAFCASIASKKAKIKIRNYCLIGLRYEGDKGIMRTLLKALEKYTCKCSTDIECVSSSCLKTAVNDKIFPPGKAVVVGSGSSGGVDLKRFDCNLREAYRREIREKYGLGDGFVFGFVGRITKDKGVDEILRAFKSINNAKLLMTGWDESESLDPVLYGASTADESIVYTGAVSEVEKIYSAIDVLLLPSYREGFGNVIIEASAMGTPAIVSNIPGPTDASIKDKTAIWIKPRDVDSLRVAMKKIMSDKQTLAEMSGECIAFIRENFSTDIINRLLLERKRGLYEKYQGKTL